MQNDSRDPSIVQNSIEMQVKFLNDVLERQVEDLNRMDHHTRDRIREALQKLTKAHPSDNHLVVNERIIEFFKYLQG